MAVQTRSNPDTPALEDLQRCVRCGYCLTDCPTYVELGQETESPRGRLHLIDAIVRGRLSATSELLAHLDRCVQCRACETACPSGVAFGRIMERGRAAVLGPETDL
jgi:glycolate oxidase iron-sulfur subunit